MTKRTKEELVVLKLNDYLSDIRLDLDVVGMYLGRYSQTASFRRLEYIYEVAKHDHEQTRESHNEYIRNMGN